MIRYWFGRARLAGVFTILPIGLVLQIGGCAVNLSAHYEPTPATVSVSGYYRKDGTYIHPYHRRPPEALSTMPRTREPQQLKSWVEASCRWLEVSLSW